MANINLREFPNELHRALKIRAAEDGTTVKSLIIKYCEDGLKRPRKKGKRYTSRPRQP